MELEGAVAVVTGAAAGIGRATAVAFARAGAEVVVADIDVLGAEQTAAEIEELGRGALALQVDVTQRGEVESMVERAIAWQGHCDLFMSNVGVGCMGAPHEFSPDEWAYMIDVNLWSCIWPLRLVIPHMLERGRGCLVFLSSGSGFEGTAERAPYNVAKFAIVGLAESCARALRGTGVDVTLVVPGAVATEGWKRFLIPAAAHKDAAEVDRFARAATRALGPLAASRNDGRRDRGRDPRRPLLHRATQPVRTGVVRERAHPKGTRPRRVRPRGLIVAPNLDTSVIRRIYRRTSSWTLLA